VVQKKDIWLTSAYFPPVSVFQEIRAADTIYFEAWENYVRQSWRNRCRILSANGILDLTIPVLKGHSPGQPIRSIRIDYHENWQKLHFRAIESAYRHSPFYEYIMDDLSRFWLDRYEFLFDYNFEITRTLIRLLEVHPVITLTDRFEKPGYYGANDFRYVFHPKNEKSTGVEPVPYHQVFLERFGFVPDLSILDWLFNCFRT
jgi:hypothetical protein